MAITFDLERGLVRILIFGTEESILELLDSLDQMSPLLYGPFIIPAVALEFQAKRFGDTIGVCHRQIHDIEYLTGMRQINHPDECSENTLRDWKKLDLIGVTRDLSSFLSRFAHLKLQADTGAYLLQQIHGSVELLRATLQRRVEHQRNIEDQNIIISQLVNTESWYLGIQARLRYLTERSQAQVQIVGLTFRISSKAKCRV